MKKRTLISEVRKMQKIAGILKENEEGNESVQQAFRKAGIDMSKPVTVIEVTGHVVEGPYKKNPMQLVGELEDLRAEAGPGGVWFDYDAATSYPAEEYNLKGMATKLAVVIDDDFEYVIFQDAAKKYAYVDKGDELPARYRMYDSDEYVQALKNMNEDEMYTGRGTTNLKENEEMPEGIVLQFVSDLGDIEEVRGTVQNIARQVASRLKSTGYKDLTVSMPAQDLAVISAGGNIIYLLGPAAPGAGEIYSLHQAGDIDGAFDAVEEIAIPNTLNGWIDHLYKQASPEEKAKLKAIYKDQMENEGAVDAREFFTDLLDSSDPEAIIDLDDLDQFTGY